MELKLDEQTFSIGPEEDNLMISSTSGFDVTSHFTSDGEVEPPLLVTPGNIVSFYIYHGTGGLNFSYELSVEPYATSGIPALRKRHAISTRGFDFSIGGSASRAEKDGSGSGAGGTSPFELVPIIVQLFRPGEDSPAYEEYFGHGQEPDQEFVNSPPVPNSGRRHFVYPITKVRGLPVQPNPNTMSHYGWWRCDVTLKGEQPANICFHSKSFIKKLVTKQTKISTRWLKHSLEIALKALTPRVSIKKDELKIELFREISESVKDIPPIIIKEQLQLSTISATGNIELVTISANPQCARDVRLVYERKIEVLESYKKSIQDDGSLVFQQKEALKAPYQRKIDFYQDNLLNMMKTYVNDDDLTIAFSAFFSNPTLEIDIPIFNNPILTFSDNPNLYIFFGKKGLPYVFSFFDTFIQLKNLDLFEESLIAIYSLFNDNINNDEDIQSIVSNKVRTALFQNSEKMFEYLSLILAKVAGQHECITHASSSTFEWTLHHYEIPQLIKLDKNGRSIITLGKFTHLIDVGEIFGPSMATTTSSSEINPTETTAAPSDPLSDIPQFKVTGGAALQRLDKIKTLIIIMKENRSFDHLLGGLKDMTPKTVISPEQTPKQNYECFDSTFSNLGTASFRGPIKPIPAKDAGFHDLFKTPVSPEHGHEHVLRQIGDGTELGKSTGSMQGFVRDFSERVAERPLLHGGSPSMVMSYYDFTKLDAYKFFAEKFCVLDHWFAAHPGPTWPNRIATHTGKLIDLENFDLSDSRIGYFKEQTIFDVLSTNNIEWRFLESNVSIMRIFDRYRMDDKNVLPLYDENNMVGDANLKSDPLNGLEVLLRQDTLPRVIFIEPRFSDVPPLKIANDDLAPADLRLGQEFVGAVYDKISKSPHWKELSLLITYDEHGGFFDHVSPPGTTESTISDIPKIHPDGPSFLGVRVPTMLISPLVSEQSVCKYQFDHTSILKTILVHNRMQLPNAELISFGDRVNQAEHFGVAFNLDTPRVAPLFTGQTGFDTTTNPSNKTSFYGNSNAHNDLEKKALQTDYHESLKKLFLP